MRATLNSVIMQKGIDFELIVIDDCSKVNLSDKIKDFFSRHDFTNYRLINHEKNLGTVKTCLEAAELSRAEYVRPIGQGDMFFDEYALRDSYNYMVKTNAEILASNFVYYRAFSNPVEIFAHIRRPQNVKAYEDPDELREVYLLNKSLLHNDRIWGVSVMYKRDVFIAYMTEAVSHGVRIAEDYVIRCMVFDKKRIKLFDRNVVFYETGAGISTTQNQERTYQLGDMHGVNNMLLERCKSDTSDFSKNLTAVINNWANSWENRQKLKAKLGIAAVPLLKIYRWIKRYIEKKNTHEEQYIKTDVNVSTDFANICMNRE